MPSAPASQTRFADHAKVVADIDDHDRIEARAFIVEREEQELLGLVNR
jgi:hypothetical protein